jgi:hypothetical protein
METWNCICFCECPGVEIRRPARSRNTALYISYFQKVLISSASSAINIDGAQDVPTHGSLVWETRLCDVAKDGN